MKIFTYIMFLIGNIFFLQGSAQTGVNLGNLTKYFMVFTDGSYNANWQGSSKGFAGDVVLNGLKARERTYGYIPFSGKMYTNKSALADWQHIVDDNSGQASVATNGTLLVSGLKSDLESAFTQINALPVTAGFDNRSASSLDGLNTKNGVGKTYVINITSGFQVSSQINITGDADDFFILRWDTDKNFGNGYDGRVKFQSGGAIVPKGDLLPSNFISVAGDINASGGGGNPSSPYPQGPRKNSGTGSLISGGTNWNGGGFFTGYWLTTGSPDISGSGQPYGPTTTISNGIFVGGWYSKTDEFCMTSGTSGCYVSPKQCSTLGSIGDRVWFDQNLNGLQDAGEYGLPSVTVKLRNSAGTEIATTTTNTSGYYNFPGLSPGSYKVEFPRTYYNTTLTTPNVGNNDEIDSDPSQSTGLTATITLDCGENNNTVDAGYCPVFYTLGNQVWYDTDNDGIFDSNEDGIVGVTVKLYTDNNNDNIPDGAATATTTTDGSGTYKFNGLLGGNYIVSVVAPAGYVKSSVGVTNVNADNQNDGVNVQGTEILTNGFTLSASTSKIDFGLLPDCGCTTSAGNLLVNASFENGITGWSFNSTNTDLYTGSGYVACGSKNAFNKWLKNTSKVWQDVNIAAGATVNFTAFAGTHTPGQSCSPTLSLIFLNASNGVISQSDVAVTRDVDKNFDQLAQYAISAVAPVGTVKVRVQSSINCDYMKLDAFCLTASAPANYSIGNNVWNDLNNNGIKDSGEPGIGGVEVKLYDCSGNYLGKTSTTDANGVYILTGLAAGNYIVGITTPAGFTKSDVGTTNVNLDNQNDGTQVSSGEIRTTCFTISASTNNIDFGLKGNLKGSIGDRVWYDVNINGLQDPGEVGLPNVIVKLRDASGTVIRTTTTNSSGFYTFAGLAAGNYKVEFPLALSGTILTFQLVGTDETIDSDPSQTTGLTNTIALANGQNITTIDAGYCPISNTLGNLVWFDANNNGIVNPGEVGIPNVTVKLYADNDFNNIPDGPAIETTTTDANGLYQFFNVFNGHYIVGITTPSGYLKSDVGVTDIDTDNQNDGVNVAGSEILTDGFDVTGSSNNIDFGLKKTFTIGNTVWFDANNNGLQDAGETGISNVTVYLYNDVNGDNIPDGPAIATVTTDPNGIYHFTGLSLGKYIVGIAPPTGYVKSSIGVTDVNTDNQNDGVNVVGSEIRTNGFTITGSTNNIDFGLSATGTGSIGDFVWNDLNGNGLQEAGEPGIPGVTVTLTYPNGSTATTTTDADGKYIFSNLPPGTTYIVTFTAPAGFEETPANVGGNDNIDSDPNGGSVPNVEVVAGVANNSVDAGFQSNQLVIGNLVWADANNNGFRDAGEPGISGITVKIYLDANGDNVADGPSFASTTTDANGNYTFTGLTPGKYIVGVVLQPGYTPGAVFNATPNDDIDNDNNGSNTSVPGEVRSNFLTLTTGGEPTNDGDGSNGNLTLDFGLIVTKKGSIGDFVWNDCNNNGLQDAGELGMAGVTVKLTLPGGAIITTVTDANGKYTFSNLAAGTYTVCFVTPQPFAFMPSPVNVGGNDAIDSDPIAGCVSVTLSGADDTSVDAGFWEDIDDDNDGIIDIVEGHGYDGLKDCDNDGIPNYLDPTPGCPTPAGVDVYGKPYKPLVWSDCNNDGVNDFFDTDRDGIIDQLDLDSDNDGILDLVETRDPSAVDANRDGMVDGGDTDGDGLLNSADKTPTVCGGPGLLPQDLDRDGIPNYLDLDSDGDGISDLTEARGFFDNDGIADGPDTDGDGVKDVYDGIVGMGAKGVDLMDNDNDGKPNPYDIDSDNDGITDNVEGQPTCNEKQPSGIDSDGDGLDDAYDVNLSSCNRKAAGITPYDKDGDGTPDIYDLDTDNDGVPDVNEGSGISGNFVTNFADTDGDGLIDQFDVFNIKTATANFTNNVTHSNMGPNGNFDGPLPSGSNAKLPQSAPGDCSTGADRDWRNVFILPVNLVDFNGNLNNKVTNLYWTSATESNLNNYTIERSVDGVTFVAIGKQKARGNSVVNTSYAFADNVGSVTSQVVYYRLSMVDNSGSSKYSNILSFKLSGKASLNIGLYPNPAKTFVQLKINSVKDGMATIRVIDAFGRVMSAVNSPVSVGSNVVNLNNISKLAAGSYFVQVITDGQILNEKLVIAR